MKQHYRRRSRPTPVRATSLATPAFDIVALIGAFALTSSLDATGWATVAVAFALLRLLGGHVRRLSPAVGDELPLLVAVLCTSGIVGAAMTGFAAETERLIESVAIAMGLVVAGRLLAYEIVRRLRSRGAGLREAIVVGSGAVGSEIAETLLRRPDYGLRPVGFVDERNGRDLSLPFLGSFTDLPAIVSEHQVDRLIIAYGPSKEEDLVGLLRVWDERSLEIFVVPRLFELGVGTDGHADDVNGIPLIKLRRNPVGTLTWNLKRAFDVVVAGIGLIVSSPALLAIAIAVRTSSPGPVFFRQTRVGRGGRLIEILKFRTMLENNDADTTWTVNGDARQTAVGRILRATHLDELPQLISVLKGDMSLVGPRPERPYYVDLFAAEIPRYQDRHRVPVGLTGWAQIHGLNGDTSIHDRARFDNRYIERWSLWRDLVIMVRTLNAVVAGFATARRADRQAQPIDLRPRVIDLTDELPATNGNGSSAHGATLVGDEQTNAAAPDGTTTT